MRRLLFLIFLIPSITFAQSYNPYVAAGRGFMDSVNQGLGVQPQPWLDPSYQAQLQAQQLQNQLLQQQLNYQNQHQFDYLNSFSDTPARPVVDQRLKTNCVTIGNFTNCN